MKEGGGGACTGIVCMEACMYSIAYMREPCMEQFGLFILVPSGILAFISHF